MISRRALAFSLILASIVACAAVMTLLDLYPPQKDVRELGKYYLFNSYFENYETNRNHTAKSPEVVTSIVWDYRGLDTVYETTVFFLAVVGGLMLFRLERAEPKRLASERVGMTLIVRQASKLLSILIAAVSTSIALHGHLTPGGGFQGGTALAVAPLLILVAYSRYALEDFGLTYLRAVIARSLALTLIWVVVVAPALNGYSIMQNQPFYPSHALGQLLSGSLLLYNLLEFLAISMGFTAIFIYLSIPEKVYSEELERGGSEEA